MSGYPWGGSEELWSRSAVLLANAGHQVTASVSYCDALSPRITQLAEAGVAVHLRRPLRLTQRVLRYLLPRTPRDARDHLDCKWLGRQRPHLSCISQGNVADGLPWSLRCLRQGLPYVVVAQANAEFLWPRDEMAEQLATAYKSARRCFFVSQNNLALLEDQIGARLENAAVVRNPFNVSYSARPAWPEPGPDWQLACVARLEPAAKGQDLLMRVLGQDKWRKRNIRVSFYGEGPCEHTSRKLAERLAIRAVDFKGQFGDVEGIWRRHHALVLPSRYEGLPLALVEAMLCARIAIVTDVAGNAELVEDGRSGFIAAAPTVGFLDAAMEAAWARRDQWECMGQEARRRAAALVPADPALAFSGQLLELATAKS